MRSLVSLSLLVAMLVPAPAAADVSGPEIVGFLNAQRAAHGIPAQIVEDPALSDGCAKHNAYNARNDTLTHEEDPAAPGYTAEGAQAGRTSVLYSGGGPWSAATNPFETAPIHLHQLLAPRTDRMGASENDGYGCATTFASRNRPAPAAAVTYTYPGDGARGWPAAQTAAEFPYTPGERAGIPAGATTGPYLYVMFDGPDLGGFEPASGARATLRGPGGPVDVAVVDNTTSGLESFLPTGAEVIPREPLAPATRYAATVQATVDGRGFRHAWSFTTADGPKPYAAKVRRRGKHIEITVTALRDLVVLAKVAGRKERARVAAGERFAERFDAPKKKTPVKVAITVAGGRFVVVAKK